MPMDPVGRIEIEFCGVRFHNPFVLAAAPPTDEIEMGVEVVFKGGFNRFQIHLHRCQDFPLEIAHATSPIRSYSIASLIRARAKHPMVSGADEVPVFT